MRKTRGVSYRLLNIYAKIRVGETSRDFSEGEEHVVADMSCT